MPARAVTSLRSNLPSKELPRREGPAVNIAFSAILALVLIVPGLIFLRVRRRSPDEIVVMLPAPQPLSIEALLAMVFATTLHIAWYALVCYPMRRVLGLDVDLATIVMLLIGKYGA